MNLPPIRMVVVGDDRQFKLFVEQYVELLDLDDSEKKSRKNRGSGQMDNQADGFWSKDQPIKIDRDRMDVRVYLIP